MNATAATVNWRTLKLTEGDSDEVWPYEPGDPDFLRYMRQFRDTKALPGYYLAPLPGQDPEAAWTWGPDYEAIDWSGLDEEIAAAGANA